MSSFLPPRYLEGLKVDFVERLGGGCGRDRDLVSGTPLGRAGRVEVPEQRGKVGLGLDHLDHAESLVQQETLPQESLTEGLVAADEDGAVHRHLPPRGDLDGHLGPADARPELLQLLAKTLHPLSSLSLWRLPERPKWTFYFASVYSKSLSCQPD